MTTRPSDDVVLDRVTARPVVTPAITVATSAAPVVMATVSASPTVRVSVAGAPGPPGETGLPGSRLEVTAGAPINVLTVVTLDEENVATPASSADPDTVEQVVGLAAHSALPGDDLDVLVSGDMTANAAHPVGPLYLGTDGALTPDPNTGDVTLRVATATSAHQLVVRLMLPIYR